MRQSSSSTLNSKFKSFRTGLKRDTDKRKLRSPVQTALLTIVWTIAFLYGLDLAINRFFPYPTNPMTTPPTALKTYFEYGRSVEGKLDRMIAPSDAESFPLAKAGWLEPSKWGPSKLPAKKNLLVAVYGMSFTDRISQAMETLDPRLSFRRISAPSAPPNHSYTAYKIDRGRHEADVVMWGILASSVRAMPTLTAMTWQVEVPAPYTYPRYVLENGSLQAIEPRVHTLNELRNVMNDPDNEFFKQLKTRDTYYEPFVFQKNFLDQSAIVRMIRRAWAQNHIHARNKAMHTAKGFENEAEIKVLQAMVKDFGRTAKQDKKFPIVVLIHDQPYDDHLYKVLGTTLKKESIPFVSTHTIAPATNLRNFIADSHFTDAADQKIAQAVLTTINQSVPRKAIAKK